MDIQRSGPHRGRRRNSPPFSFSLRSFERRLRSALEFECTERDCGAPGSSETTFSGNTSRVAVSWLFSNLLSKYDDGDKSKRSERSSAAMVKFWQAEERCFWTNLLFCSSEEELVSRIPELVHARAHILDLLGHEVPMEELSRNFGHGGGSTTRVSKRHGNSVFKYGSDVEVTPNTLALGQAAILANPVWKQTLGIADGAYPDLTTVWGNSVLTIPKNYKTDRVIAQEPDMNMYVQKGLGAVLRRRLKKVGVDLDDQTLNQEAASDLQNATIDFSMASDLVSQGLVNFLLPPNWRDIIASMRSEFGIVEGRIHRYSKVSSMGNGFTFELESLIFWALARAVVPHELWDRIRVYGDDVILPAEYAEAYMELSNRCGFIPNGDKSHWQGLFRESCGTHYYDGCDITPFYIKEPVENLPGLFKLHNRLRRWQSRMEGILTQEHLDNISGVLAGLRALAPKSWRKPRIPDGKGDGAFIGTFDECKPRLPEQPDGWECQYKVEVLVDKVNEHPDRIWLDDGALVKAHAAFARRTRIFSPLFRYLHLYENSQCVEPTLKGVSGVGFVRLSRDDWADIV